MWIFPPNLGNTNSLMTSFSFHFSYNSQLYHRKSEVTCSIILEFIFHSSKTCPWPDSIWGPHAWEVSVLSIRPFQLLRNWGFCWLFVQSQSPCKLKNLKTSGNIENALWLTTTSNLHITDILMKYHAFFFWYVHKSDDSLNWMALAILSKLTKHKIANVMQKTEYKILEICCSITFSLFIKKKLSIYRRIP